MTKTIHLDFKSHVKSKTARGKAIRELRGFLARTLAGNPGYEHFSLGIDHIRGLWRLVLPADVTAATIDEGLECFVRVPHSLGS